MISLVRKYGNQATDPVPAELSTGFNLVGASGKKIGALVAIDGFSPTAGGNAPILRLSVFRGQTESILFEWGPSFSPILNQFGLQPPAVLSAELTPVDGPMVTTFFGATVSASNSVAEVGSHGDERVFKDGVTVGVDAVNSCTAQFRFRVGMVSVSHFDRAVLSFASNGTSFSLAADTWFAFLAMISTE